MRWIRPTFFACVVLAVPAVAHAERVPYQQSFDGSVTGWQLHGLWSIDGTPATVPGGPSYSGSQSLNFNDGTDYDGLQRASCASPAVEVVPSALTVVRFRCNYSTETTSASYDQRSVSVRVNGAVVSEHSLWSSPKVPLSDRCGAMGVWHTHEIHVPANVAAKTQVLQVDFVFDSVDTLSNNYAGWFIDDFEVTAMVPKLPGKGGDSDSIPPTFETIPAPESTSDANWWALALTRPASHDHGSSPAY